MKDLLEALTIFYKYTEARRPTTCEHDTLYVLVDPRDVSEPHKSRLDALGFVADPAEAHFYSFRFGSA